MEKNSQNAAEYFKNKINEPRKLIPLIKFI